MPANEIGGNLESIAVVAAGEIGAWRRR